MSAATLPLDSDDSDDSDMATANDSDMCRISTQAPNKFGRSSVVLSPAENRINLKLINT